jgi:ATP phosphoribosyltransferase
VNNRQLTIALPKGRLQEQVSRHFSKFGITIREESRKLDFHDEANHIRFLFVKNSDVPVYVNYGVADLGICGSDVIFESGFEFIRLKTLPFGSTRICLAGYEKDRDLYFSYGSSGSFLKEIRIATKFTRFTSDFFEGKNIPVRIIELRGSIELAPILGLTDFIVDLVETGTTLKENNLSVIEQIGSTQVEFFANMSLYKLKYQQIQNILDKIREA